MDGEVSRTYKHSKPIGLEYWKSRLHKYGEEPGRYTKYLTHKKERRDNKQQTKEEWNDKI